MPVDWRERAKGATEAELEALERLLGVRLPDEFRRFLLTNNGGVPESNEFSIPMSGGNESGVTEFMTTQQIARAVSDLRGRLPDGVIPIAFAEGGNLVCLRLGDGFAIFWDHELEPDDPVFELAQSFAEFSDMLKPFDPTTIELQPGQVKSVWVDPDLLRKPNGPTSP